MMQRPEFPRDKPADDPAWIKFHKQMSRFVEEKRQAELELIPKTEPDIRAYSSAQKANPPKKKPAWSGATPEYLREKKREERERRGCVDCGKPKKPKRMRCEGCQVKADRISADKKNAAKRERLRLIREGLKERGGKR